MGAREPEPFRLDGFDALFAARTTPEDWRRILVLRDHPRFLDGVRQYAVSLPPFFAHNLILNRVVTEAWRFQMLVYTLYLFDKRDYWGNPRAGLTASNLQQICRERGIASPGRVMAILGIMRLGGYLERRKSAQDSRIVHLEPTPAFVKIVEGWNACMFANVDAIFPEGRLVEAHKAHSRFGWEMRRRGAETLLGGWMPIEPFAEIMPFINSDGGWMLLATCIGGYFAPSGGFAPAPVAIDLAALGKRTGVSRTHLRRLLEGAFAKGLLEAPPRNGAHVALKPVVVAAFLAFLASELGYYRLWALEAKAELGIGEDAPRAAVAQPQVAATIAAAALP